MIYSILSVYIYLQFIVITEKNCFPVFIALQDSKSK